MSFAIFKGEKSTSDLVNRLFRLQGKASQALAKQAADALLKANPQLKDISKVPLGALINVPETAPPIHPAEQAAEPALIRAAAVARAQQSMDSLLRRLADIDARAIEATNSILAMAQSPGSRSAAKKNADLKQSLAGTVKSAKARLKALQASGSTRTKAAAELHKGLALLVDK